MATATSTCSYITVNAITIDDTAQLNNIGAVGDKPDQHDRNTTDADSVHDELHPDLKKTSTHDDDIFSYTIYGTTPLVSQLNALYTQDVEPGVNGNVPKEGQCECLIFDAGHQSSIPGINNFLDSATTPSLNEVIDSMRLDDGLIADYTTLTGVGAKSAAPGDLYKFTLFDSLLNVKDDPTVLVHPPPKISKNKLDFTAFSNYDILIFAYAIHTVTKDTAPFDAVAPGDIATMLNALFTSHKGGSDPEKLNVLQLITIVNLNFLWVCTIRYINQTLNDGVHDAERELSLKLLNIRFIEMIVSKKSNIKEPKFQIGHTEPLPPAVDLKKPQDYVTSDAARENYTNSFTYTLLKHYNFIPAPPNPKIIQDCPSPIITYPFYTSQSFCARKIIELNPIAKVKDRSEDSENNNNVGKENEMSNGIDAFFDLTDINLKEDKIFIFRLLKFQGDTTHVVISHIINTSYKLLVLDTETVFKFVFNGMEFQPIAPDLKAPLIKILTGERPLFARGVLEGVNIKAENFKIFHTYFDPGTTKYIKHDANKCSIITNIISNYKLNLTNTLTVVPGLDAEIKEFADCIIELYNKFINEFNTKHIKPYTGGAPDLIEKHKTLPGNYTDSFIIDYINALVMDDTKCEEYITDKLFSNLKILYIQDIDILSFSQYCAHFYGLFDLFKEYNSIGDIITEFEGAGGAGALVALPKFDLQLLDQKSTGNSSKKKEMIGKIQKLVSFIRNF